MPFSGSLGRLKKSMSERTKPQSTSAATVSSTRADKGSESSSRSNISSSQAPAEASTQHTQSPLKRKLRRESSMTSLLRKFSKTSVTGDGEVIPDYTDQTKDEEDGAFCDSLLGLMERKGGYEDLDFSRDKPTKEQRETSATKAEEPKAQDSSDAREKGKIRRVVDQLRKRVKFPLLG